MCIPRNASEDVGKVTCSRHCAPSFTTFLSLFDTPYTLRLCAILEHILSYLSAGDLCLFQSFHACLSSSVIIKTYFEYFSVLLRLRESCALLPRSTGWWKETVYGTAYVIVLRKMDQLSAVVSRADSCSARQCTVVNLNVSLPTWRRVCCDWASNYVRM